MWPGTRVPVLLTPSRNRSGEWGSRARLARLAVRPPIAFWCRLKLLTWLRTIGAKQEGQGGPCAPWPSAASAPGLLGPLGVRVAGLKTVHQRPECLVMQDDQFRVRVTRARFVLIERA